MTIKPKKKKNMTEWMQGGVVKGRVGWLAGRNKSNFIESIIASLNESKVKVKVISKIFLHKSIIYSKIQQKNDLFRNTIYIPE